MIETQTASETLTRGMILGNCVVVQTLAQCGSGEAYFVRDIDDGSVYVIKENCVYSRALCDETRDSRAPRIGGMQGPERTTAHFYNEAQLLSSLDHPNIVKAVRVFPAGETAYFAMPYAEGRLLDVWVAEHGAPDQELLYTLQRSMLSALDYLHRRNLVHGGVEPSSIFVPEIGEPILLDFGAASYIGDEEKAPSHALPEGQEAPTPADDLTALGATLYFAVTGRYPKTGSPRDPEDAEEPRVLGGDAVLVGRYGKILLEAIDRALDQTPGKRWQDAEEWSLTLDSVEHKTNHKGKDAEAPKETPDQGKRLWGADAPDDKAKRYGSVIVIMVLVILSAITYMLSLQSEKEAAARAAAEGGSPRHGRDKAETAGQGVASAAKMSPAVAECLQLAEDGSAEAQVNIAMFYSLGLGVEQNGKEAVRWAYRAAAQGKMEAHAMLGKFYLNGYGVDQNYAEAIKWYRKAAERGHVESQCRLGILCACGHGAVKDGPEGLKWLRMAAEQGQTEAEYLAGLCYAGGHSVKRNIEEGRMWFQKASNQGAVRSFLFCGICEGMSGRAAEAEKWLKLSELAGSNVARQLLPLVSVMADEEKCREALKPIKDAAEQGDAEAQCVMGVCYSVGLGVAPSLDESVKSYGKSAAGGCAEGRDNLALFYIFGRSVDLDFKVAAKLFTQAAEQGYSPAQCSLGTCYMMGRGVERDSALAFKWYLSAAEQGLSDAQCNVGTCYIMGLGVDQNPAKAVEFYKRAAEQGLVDAQFYLGGCYLEGIGVPLDKDEAIKWYRRAALQGNTEASQIVDSLEMPQPE